MPRTKEVTIDLRTASLFGPSCKSLELLEDLRYRKYRVRFIAKNWEMDCKNSGVIFDKKSKSFQTGSSQFLWDPKLHPVDFYENLMLPTFSNIEYIKVPAGENLFKRVSKHLKFLLCPRYLTYTDILYQNMDHDERKCHQQQMLDRFFENPGLKGALHYLRYCFAYKISHPLKVQAESRGFRYKLREELLDDNVKQIISDAKSRNVPYVLISANWDDEQKFERLPDRLRGIFSTDVEFNSMVRYVKALDHYAQKGKIRLVLASKKAVDWDKILKSDFLDLRCFEEKGLTLSQSLYVIQEITKLTINWPTTFSTWITNCSHMLHLTWGSQKDTAKWARNQLHREPVETALSLIDAI